MGPVPPVLGPVPPVQARGHWEQGKEKAPRKGLRWWCTGQVGELGFGFGFGFGLVVVVQVQFNGG